MEVYAFALQLFCQRLQETGLWLDKRVATSWTGMQNPIDDDDALPSCAKALDEMKGRRAMNKSLCARRSA